MKRVKLDDTYVANVEEGTRSRLEKATRRGMDPVQVQALSNFATKIRNTIDEHRDDTITISTTPATPNSKKYEEELSKRVDVMGDLLSAIVSRVLKHRTDTPQIVESIKPPPKKPVPTNEPAVKIDNPQVDGIFIPLYHFFYLSFPACSLHHVPLFHLQYKISYKRCKTCWEIMHIPFQQQKKNSHSY